MRDFLGLALGAAIAIVCAGCPGKPCPTTPHTDGALALRYHRAGRSHIRAIRAEARVDQRGEQGRIRGTVLMFVERPDRVRFDAMTQFGPAAILTSDGRRFALSDLREDRYLVGPTCPVNIGRLLGIPMSGEDVARFLFGDTPVIEATEKGIACTEDGTYLVSLRAESGRRQEIELDVREGDRELPPEQQRLRLVRSETFSAGGQTEWRVELDDYRVVEDPRSGGERRMGVAMPYRIHFFDRAHDADVILRFEDIDLNVDVPDDAFQQSARPGMAVEEVSCDG